MTRPGHNPRYDAGVRALMAKRDEVDCLRYARDLAISLSERFYPRAPKLQPLDTLPGLLSQIDNMTSGLLPMTTAQLLAGHWLWQMICNHEAHTDVASCACGWRSGEMASVGDAAEAWAEHALSASAASPAIAQSSRLADPIPHPMDSQRREK